MPRNPYSPPAAPVAEPHDSPRPPQVTRACQILWTVIVLSAFSMHPAISGEWWAPADSVEVESSWIVIGISIAVAFAAAYVALVWLVGQRHNWARWVLLAFVAVSSLFAALDLQTTLTETPLLALANLLFTLLEIWAFSLLFFGPGARWFRG